ncbi:MAG: S-layer homology domain-containing protein, partial [Oscillospiraceae bacterium]|nr:S-layer homology domain-containing protein [Oscillospiraceae bacterium]
MGVIRGSEGKINAQGEVTRAEMAAFIYRVYTGDVDRDQEFLYADTGTQFTDVESGAWYSGVIGFCSSHAFILGRGDGTFDPNAGVTGYEALVMILRALGYGQDNEFSGGEWQQTVHTRAINIGLFQNINASSYSYSLPKKATREFVAELLFQGIQKPMVTYNRGYVNHYEFINSGTGVANQTIGQWQFGLTAHTGILLGNESTGEQATKIGFAVDPVFSYNGAASAADRLIGGTINDDVSKYVNVGTVASPSAGNSAYLYSNTDATIGDLQNKGANVTLSFVDNTVYDVIAKETVVDDTAKTGLDLFNHKVKVWYDNRSTATESVMASTTPSSTNGDLGVVNFPTNLTTYSIIDKATLAKTVVVDPSAVSAGNTTGNDARDTALTGWTKGGANPQNLGEAAYNAGFNVRETNTDWAYWNYAFSPLQTTDYAANTDSSSASKFSPIHKNDSATTYQLYQVISNSADKSVDVVISLDLSINEIAEENRYQLPNSFAVWNSN